MNNSERRLDEAEDIINALWRIASEERQVNFPVSESFNKVELTGQIASLSMKSMTVQLFAPFFGERNEELGPGALGHGVHFSVTNPRLREWTIGIARRSLREIYKNYDR